MSDLVSQNLNMIFKTPKGETVITAGFIRPTSGSITLNSKEIDGPGVERGMVFQQGALFEWLTVAENVNFGLRMKKKDPIEYAAKSCSCKMFD